MLQTPSIWIKIQMAVKMTLFQLKMIITFVWCGFALINMESVTSITFLF